MFSEDEITRKLPVWHALSALFLDTELQRRDYDWMAATLTASGYALEQLRAILENEVAPAFAFNIFDVAGEWSPWSEEEVRTIMLRHHAKPRQWLKEDRLKKIVTLQWGELLPLLDRR